MICLRSELADRRLGPTLRSRGGFHEVVIDGGGVVAIVAVALGIGVAGCGSDGEKAESTSAEQTSETSATPEQAAPEMTIAEYIQQNGIVETPGSPRRSRRAGDRVAGPAGGVGWPRCRNGRMTR